MAKFKVGDRVRLTAGRTGTVTAVHAVHDRCHVKAWSDDHRREVEYLVPDEQLTLADPAPTGPRYVVRAAGEMREGEPCYPFTVLAANLVDLFNSDPNEAGNCKMREWAPRSDNGVRRVSAIVDTRPDSPAPSRTPPPPPAPVAPPRPSDAEVCAAWEAQEANREACIDSRRRLGWNLDATDHGPAQHVSVGGVSFTLADYRTARSNELRRLAAVSAERERLRVVVQCQDGGECDV